ncbi:MAG TPA: hypothetical protein VN455_05640 [Methanotrichaceae archaeon]|nr:hypothetical protein [Methanotrichaceae archaeon]
MASFDFMSWNLRIDAYARAYQGTDLFGDAKYLEMERELTRACEREGC